MITQNRDEHVRENRSDFPKFVIRRCTTDADAAGDTVEQFKPFYTLFSAYEEGPVYNILFRGPLTMVQERVLEEYDRDDDMKMSDMVHIMYNMSGDYTQLTLGWFVSDVRVERNHTRMRKKVEEKRRVH